MRVLQITRLIAAGSWPLVACWIGIACVPALDPELARQAQSIPILSRPEIGGREFVKVGDVDGLSCAMHSGTRPDMEEAEIRMRVAAMQRGASAVIGERCVEGGTDWSNNCFNTIKCRGEAIKWTGKDAAPPADHSH